jgi:hypothetical protein
LIFPSREMLISTKGISDDAAAVITEHCTSLVRVFCSRWTFYTKPIRPISPLSNISRLSSTRADARLRHEQRISELDIVAAAEAFYAKKGHS